MHGFTIVRSSHYIRKLLTYIGSQAPRQSHTLAHTALPRSLLLDWTNLIEQILYDGLVVLNVIVHVITHASSGRFRIVDHVPPIHPHLLLAVHVAVQPVQ